VNIVNDLDILQDELTKCWEAMDDPYLNEKSLNIRKLIASGWKDEKLKEEIEIQTGIEEGYIEQMWLLRTSIDFVTTEEPTDEEFQIFQKELVKKQARKTLDDLERGYSV
jgi:hypothetical protein